MAQQPLRRPFVSYGRSNYLIVLGLAVATIFVYAQVRHFEFINFDDNHYITENPAVREGLSAGGILWALTDTSTGNWHPLTWLSHMLDVHLHGLNPGRHHLVNVLFHAANAVLLFIVLNKMTGSVFRSGVASALFALHPLHVESVAWISERKDVLSTFLLMVTLWCYSRYVEQPERGTYLAVVLCFMLGLLAKPMLVTLPFLLILIDYWPLKRFALENSPSGAGPWATERFWLLVREKIPLFTIAAFSGIVTILAERSGGSLASLQAHPLHFRVLNAIESYLGYIAKLFWPFRLAVFYPYPDAIPAWRVAGAFFLLAGITLLIGCLRKRFPYCATGWFWYLAALLPVAGLIQVGSQAMADRYTYVPTIGLFIIIAWATPDLLSGWRFRTPAVSALTALFLLNLAVCAFIHAGYWQNSITLFTRAIQVTRNNPMAHNNLGIALAEGGRLPEAIQQFSESLRINPGYAMAHANMGIACSVQGKTADAIRHFSEAVRIEPLNPTYRNRLGKALLAQNKPDQAAGHLIHAVRMDPRFSEARFNLANALAAGGRLEGAVEQYEKALRLDPANAKIHNNLAIVLARQGNRGKALDHFSLAMTLAPNDATIAANHSQARNPRDRPDTPFQPKTD